ncbi:hypothetical protein BJ546DRAFT_946977 [Cryomyces antarcticus]
MTHCASLRMEESPLASNHASLPLERSNTLVFDKSLFSASAVLSSVHVPMCLLLRVVPVPCGKSVVIVVALFVDGGRTGGIGNSRIRGVAYQQSTTPPIRNTLLRNNQGLST